MGCDAIHNRQSRLRVPKPVPASRERGPQNHFGLAALLPEGALSEYLGAARSPNLGGNIVLIQPSGTRPDRGLQKLPLLLRPLQRSLHTNLRLPACPRYPQAPSAGR
jgi:hypothetical protein